MRLRCGAARRSNLLILLRDRPWHCRSTLDLYAAIGALPLSTVEAELAMAQALAVAAPVWFAPIYCKGMSVLGKAGTLER
jgi:hypothetical protein